MELLGLTDGHLIQAMALTSVYRRSWFYRTTLHGSNKQSISRTRKVILAEENKFKSLEKLETWKIENSNIKSTKV